ncbi:MAG TPA: family 1 encapsulin nanocompartment shell protein [Acidimicrobiia bacterium]|jgi:uncharacterized linocin/CFP29 family protein|nr:family 1 encapsulin nanocompartment shell protein [Acidimicrobiia bacterium]
MSDHLLRGFAPISDAAWSAIEDDVIPKLKTQLAARKLVDFTGPTGWDRSSVNLGRALPIAEPAPGLSASQRVVLPLVELRAEFTLSRRELEDVDRGALDVDFSALDEAATTLARAENRAVFHGYGDAGIRGLVEVGTHEPIPLGSDANRYPTEIAGAVNVLREAGIGGPYGLAIAPEIYTAIVESTEHGGYPLFEHLHQILEGPVVWAPGIDCGAVLSQRGDDFVFDSGQDIAIGYRSHDAEDVTLYLEESFTFRVLEPDAVVALDPPKG